MMQEVVQEHSTSFVIDNVEEEATSSAPTRKRGRSHQGHTMSRCS